MPRDRLLVRPRANHRDHDPADNHGLHTMRTLASRFPADAPMMIESVSRPTVGRMFVRVSP